MTDVTDATLGASGIWLGTRRGAGGSATLTESFFGRSHKCSPPSRIDGTSGDPEDNGDLISVFMSGK